MNVSKANGIVLFLLLLNALALASGAKNLTDPTDRKNHTRNRQNADLWLEIFIRNQYLTPDPINYTYHETEVRSLQLFCFLLLFEQTFFTRFDIISIAIL